MATVGFNQEYVKCPYYRSDDNRERITCEWVGDATINWRFNTKEAFGIQMREFCQGGYWRCEVCQMLDHIYEEDDT